MDNKMRVFFTHVRAKDLVNVRLPFDGRHIQASPYVDGWRVVWLKVGHKVGQEFIDSRLARIREVHEVIEWEEKA